MNKTIKAINTLTATYKRKIDKRDAEITKLKELLTEIAGVVHHGVFIGYASEEEAMRQVRILAAPYWDKFELSRMERDLVKELNEAAK